MVLMATDLPEPVVPAISICGVRARSMMMDSPPMFLPRQSGSLATDSSFTASSSRKYTFSRFGLGNSMPIALRPETTATRAESALIERAMSSASPITRDDLMPGAGSSSYSVTTGPGRALMTWPRGLPDAFFCSAREEQPQPPRRLRPPLRKAVRPVAHPAIAVPSAVLPRASLTDLSGLRAGTIGNTVILRPARAAPGRSRRHAQTSRAAMHGPRHPAPPRRHRDLRPIAFPRRNLRP